MVGCETGSWLHVSWRCLELRHYWWKKTQRFICFHARHVKLFQQSLGLHKWLGKGNESIRERNEPLHYMVVVCLFHHVKWGNNTGIRTKVHRCPQHMPRWFLGHHRKLLDVHHNKLHIANLAKFLRDLTALGIFIRRNSFNSSCKQNRFRLQATFLPFDAYARVCLMAGGEMHNWMGFCLTSASQQKIV